jgi:hypothetical protein
VAEQFLNDAQIGAVLQKMAREGMAEHMPADPRGANPAAAAQALSSRANAWRVRVRICPPDEPNFRNGSTPAIENSEPNLRTGWKAVIRSSHLNVNSPDGRRLRLARERLTASHYEFTVVNKDMVAVTGTAT